MAQAIEITMSRYFIIPLILTGIVGLVIAGVVGYGWANANFNDDARHNGRHCLNYWTGQHTELRNRMRDHVENLQLFDVIRTTVHEAGSYGETDHYVTMDVRYSHDHFYYHILKGEGWIDHETCEVAVISFREQ